MKSEGLLAKYLRLPYGSFKNGITRVKRAWLRLAVVPP